MTRGVQRLIELVPVLENSDYGEWSKTGHHEGTPEDPIPMPHVIFDDCVGDLIDAVNEAVDDNPDYGLRDYQSVLKEYGLEWKEDSLISADASRMDERGVLALILSVIRADRFSEGTLLRFLREGYILNWLKELS